MADIVDRLETVTRDFDDALFIGAGSLADMLTPACGVRRVAAADLAAGRLPRSGARFVMDEERSPIAPASFDLIVSLLTLHGVNDIIGALAQARLALKPDGLFLAALFGGETLRELKTALLVAESEISGGASARIPPFPDARALGQAMQRAGFALPVVDIDGVDIRYRNAARLFKDLKGIGEAGVLAARSRRLARGARDRALDLLGEVGAVRVDIIYLTGWAPHPSQPKPLQPGSATHSLEEAVKGGPRD